QDLIGGLLLSALGGLQPPGQPRLRFIQAHRRLKILAAQSNGGEGGSSASARGQSEREREKGKLSSTAASLRCAHGRWGRPPCRLKIKLINVRFVKDERLAQQDVVALNLEVAQRAGFERLVARLERAFGQGISSLHRQPAQVFGL